MPLKVKVSRIWLTIIISEYRFFSFIDFFFGIDVQDHAKHKSIPSAVLVDLITQHEGASEVLVVLAANAG
ncbi:hypothetical protein SHVI106290_18185 [Shewanella violacea]